jgi:hypothetical protein
MNTLNRIWRSHSFHRWGIPALLFLVAFPLRIVYPISRPMVWFERAFYFTRAVLEGNWGATYQRYHPGVTITWLAGIPEQIFAARNGGLTIGQMMGFEPLKAGLLQEAQQVSIILVVIVIAACIALTYPLLRRLAGQRIALAGALLLALEPFYVGYSKVIHPDALLTSFMIVSALFLLVYLKEGRWLMLLLSGVFAGLSLLSKSPAVFLIPYAGLATTTAAVIRWQRAKPAPSLTGWSGVLWQLLRTLAIWGVVAGIVFFIAWPSMWVEPVQTVSLFIGGILRHRTRFHPNPVFFNGQIYETDPGIGFFLATIGWKSTVVTLPFFLISAGFALRRWREPRSWPLWAMLAYAFFFLIQMSLANFKQVAYILPLFPALDIAAAFGLVWSAEALAKKSDRPRLASGIIAAVLVLQALLTLASYPYFSAHYNRLLGGTRTAQRVLPLQDHGEGMEVAARYLSSLPHGQDETAIIFERSAPVFQREFVGRTLATVSPFHTYRIYGVNELVRGLREEEWQELWRADSQTEPLYTVDINGVTYVWVYGELPQDPTQGGPAFDMDFRLGDRIQLKEARLLETEIEPGETITLALIWEALAPIDRDYTVFAHLLSAGGELAAQQDNVPLFGIRPTFTWRVAEELEDPLQIQTGADLEPGNYTLSVGMYDSETFERLPVFDGNGDQVQEDRIVIAEIRVVGEAASGE